MKSESNHNVKEIEVDGLLSLRQGTPPILVESDISTGTDSLRSISDDLVLCKIQPTTSNEHFDRRAKEEQEFERANSARKKKVSFHDTKNSTCHQRVVSFDKVEIHYHDIILGDNPDCVEGPPISIDWGYFDKVTLSIDHFEHTRRGKRRKGEKNLFISSLQRLKLLKGTGKYKSSEIYDRMDEVQSIRKERQNSCRGLVWKNWVRNVFHQNPRKSSPSSKK